MTTVTAKYLLRRDTVAFYNLLDTLYWTIQEVKKHIAGESCQYQRTKYPLAKTLQEEVTLVRHFCEEMLALMPEVVKLGGHVPEDPMSIIELWLSMAESPAEPD